MATIEKLKAADKLTESGNVLTCTSPYLLVMNTASDVVEAYLALTSAGAPALGAEHPSLSSLIVIDRAVDHFKNQKDKFTVIVSYSNQRTDIDEQSQENPLDLPASISMDQVDRQVPVEFDVETGLKIRNSAKRPFGAITENKPLTRITIQRNERNYNNTTANTMRNTINSSSFRIDGYTYDTGTVKLEKYFGDKQFDNEGNSYYRITYQMLVDEENGFVRKLIDRGDKDINGASAGKNVPIDSQGAAFLSAGEFILDPDAEPEIIDANTLRKASFSQLRL